MRTSEDSTRCPSRTAPHRGRRQGGNSSQRTMSSQREHEAPYRHSSRQPTLVTRRRRPRRRAMRRVTLRCRCVGKSRSARSPTPAPSRKIDKATTPSLTMNLARAGDGSNRRVARHSTDDVTRTSGPGPPSFGSCSRRPVCLPAARTAVVFLLSALKEAPRRSRVRHLPSLSIFDIEVELILFAAAADDGVGCGGVAACAPARLPLLRQSFLATAQPVRSRARSSSWKLSPRRLIELRFVPSFLPSFFSLSFFFVQRSPCQVARRLRRVVSRMGWPPPVPPPPPPQTHKGRLRATRQRR